jgi:hypothetical protein
LDVAIMNTSDSWSFIHVNSVPKRRAETPESVLPDAATPDNPFSM